MTREARLTVDLDALAANYATLTREAGSAEVAPVVKADAYGMGLGPAARTLWAQGARRFFVARGSEGLALRAHLGLERAAHIHVLDGCGPDDPDALAAAGLSPVLNSLVDVQAWAACARRLGRVLSACLHVDTGMNRLGLRPEEAIALADSQDGLRGIELDLLITHFASAEDLASPMADEQLARFAPAAERFAGVPVSLGASAGLFRGAETRGEVVRPGITLVGGGPFQRPDERIRPVATLDAPILQVRTVRPGETVGYGASFRAERTMQLAIAAIGYADGVLRTAERPRYAWFAGAKRPLVGRISMDLIAVDVTGCSAQPGARVELFGPNLPVDEAAADAGTIAFELLSNIAPRVERVYVGGRPAA